ncbi:DUF4123 domain-containing protein [Fulvimarina sp. MAC3]|uniref:DUF4123 domain-containing protein n=1 Tax=Fulvimarina sp. MAC3 TaxID=3148887 RepID=UPI0031FDBAD4
MDPVKDFARSLIDGSHTSDGPHLIVGLDPGRHPQLPAVAKGLSNDARCLYNGVAADEYGLMAPWIVEDPYRTFSEYLIDEYIGENCFVLFLSNISFDEFHMKFRKLVKIVEVEKGERFWRFFRPDGLGTFLPFMTVDQRAAIFSGIKLMGMEVHNDPEVGFGAMQFREDGSLATKFLVPMAERPLAVRDAIIHDIATSLPNNMKLNLEGAAARPRMTFTTAQMEAPVLFNRPKLIASTIRVLEEDFASAMAVIGERQLAMHISYGIDLAMKKNLWDVTAIQTFVDLMFRVAPGWHRQRSLAAVLDRSDLAPMEKLELIVTESFNSAWDEAATFNSTDEWYPGGFGKRDI